MTERFGEWELEFPFYRRLSMNAQVLHKIFPSQVAFVLVYVLKQFA